MHFFLVSHKFLCSSVQGWALQTFIKKIKQQMTREAKVKLCNHISLKSGERTENIVLVHATIPKGLCELGSSELCLPFGWWSQDLWYQRDQAFCCSSVKSELIQYLWNQQTHPITGMPILACCSSCAACCQKLIVPQCPTTFSLTFPFSQPFTQVPSFPNCIQQNFKH